MPRGEVTVIAPDARGEVPSVSVRTVAEMELDGVRHEKDSVFDMDRNVARNLVSAGLVKRARSEDVPPAAKPAKRKRSK